MGTIIVLVGLVSACVTVAAGLLGIRRYFKPERSSQILNPPSGSESGGRRLTVSGIIPKRRRGTIYWIAVQPSDCRDQDLWWPQRHPLEFEPDGSWVVRGVTLGRERGSGGDDDIDKLFTIGLFEIPMPVREKFHDDVPIARPPDCLIIHAIDVRRVRY